MTSPDLPPERRAKLDDLTNAYLDAVEGIDKYSAMKEEAANQLIAELGVGGRHSVAPHVGVQVVGAARRFDAHQAASVLTVEQYNSICVPVPDRTQAEAVLPGALLDLCKVSSGRPQVRRLSR